jgi:hypothetical protein
VLVLVESVLQQKMVGDRSPQVNGKRRALKVRNVYLHSLSIKYLIACLVDYINTLNLVVLSKYRSLALDL